MRILKGFVLLLIKILVVPLILLLTLLTYFANMALNLSAYVLGPLMTLIFCIIIYTVWKRTWFHTGMLSAIEAGIATLYFGAAWIIFLFEDLRNALLAFVMN